MSVKLTTAYWKIKELSRKIRILQGGQGASKTYSILINIFEQAYNSYLKDQIFKATIVTETYVLLRDGAISDFKAIVNECGLNFNDYYNISDKNFILGTAEIQFRNVDNKDFHKSKSVRRDVLFINEGNRMGWASVDQLLTRSKVVFIDFNPDRQFWVHEQLFDRHDSDVLVLTYNDNEMLSDEERKEIETRVEQSKLPDAKNSLKEWVRVYAYGELGTYSDSQIYNYEFIDEIPTTARRIPSGMDFGRSPDPTILVDLFLEGNNLYADEVFCENNLLPERIEGAERPSIVDRLDDVGHIKGHIIIADSSGATEINDIRKYGYKIKGVHKPRGAQAQGINKLRSYNLFITKRSKNIKKGCEDWHFKIDHNGKVIPEPDGHEPDGLVAIRYVLMDLNKSSVNEHYSDIDFN